MSIVECPNLSEMPWDLAASGEQHALLIEFQVEWEDGHAELSELVVLLILTFYSSIYIPIPECVYKTVQLVYIGSDTQ